jgi:hypothetical protein
MTREEAIRHGKEQLEIFGEGCEHYEFIKMAIKALEQNERAEDWYKLFCEKLDEQEPNRDTEEIAEIMKSDADAETKCKMISNILTAKPHYFEISQEPCDDTVSRQAVIEMAYDMSEIDGEHFTEPCMVVDVEDIQKLPSVNPIPCLDAISREAVDKRLVELLSGDLYNEEMRDKIVKLRLYLFDLPSVNVKPIECEDAVSREAVLDTTICEGDIL